MNESRNPVPARAGTGRTPPARPRVARVARLGLGGIILGSCAGVYAGALLGAIAGAWFGSLTLILDGALIGGAALALGGAVYGIVLGLTERSPDHPVPAPEETPDEPRGEAIGWNRLAIVAVACLALAASASAQDAEAERVRFTTADEAELHGTFYSGTRRSPVVMLVHAIGKKHSSRDWDRLPAYLHDKGYAVLAFDLRGHGRSRAVEPSVFWSSRYPANRRYVRGPHGDEITVNDFDPRYLPVLVNDLAAAKAFLDRKNDQGECNSSNLVIIGAEDGATLGALWLNSEWYRHRLVPAAFPGISPQIDASAEGNNVLCGLWLSISPRLGNRSVPLSALLDLPGRQKKVPMVFMHAAEDDKGKALARALERHLKSGQKLPYTGAVEIPAVEGEGTKLLAGEAAAKAIADYLDAVSESSAREWMEREARDTQYVWRGPGRGVRLANVVGSNTLNYDTYVTFLPRGR
jgi:hypothetical protein